MCEQELKLEQKLEQEHRPVSYELPSVDLLSENSDLDLENQKVVLARSIFESGEWKNSDAKIPLALGEDKNRKPAILDLAKPRKF